MEWDARAIMNICIGVFFLLFGGGMAYAFIRLGSVLGRLTGILADVNKEITPLLTRIEGTLDGVNSELGRVDDITGSVATMVKTAEQTTTAVQEAVAKPIKKVSSLAAAVNRGVSSFFSSEGRKS
jgi:ABC-type transporter Mla subunit MlaD